MAELYSKTKITVMTHHDGIFIPAFNVTGLMGLWTNNVTGMVGMWTKRVFNVTGLTGL